jgi:membrane-associated protein
MQYKKFISYNVFGGALWTLGLTLSGYFLGQKIPNIDHYLLPIIALIIFLSFLPAVFHLISHRSSTT